MTIPFTTDITQKSIFTCSLLFSWPHLEDSTFAARQHICCRLRSKTSWLPCRQSIENVISICDGVAHSRSKREHVVISVVSVGFRT